jgi:hypothetical protein
MGVRRPPVSIAALHDAQQELEHTLGEIPGAPAARAAVLTENLIRHYVEEFDRRRRDWIRAVIAMDPAGVTRVLADPMLPRKVRAALEQDPVRLDEALTDMVVDRLGTADPRDTRGWLHPDAQSFLDAVPDEVTLQFRVLREARNLLTHDSAEARTRLRDALRELGAADPRFELNQPVTRRVVVDWLRALAGRRLRIVCGCIPQMWQAMLAAEAALRPELATEN